MGGSDMRMVGTGGIVDSALFVTVLGSVLGTRFAVLGSGLWNTERTRFRKDRVEAALITTCSSVGRTESGSRTMRKMMIR
jgi:hypothetical protein